MFKTCRGRLNYVKFLSGTAQYWPCISFTSHRCWSIFQFCSTVSNAWLQSVNEIVLGRVYTLNFDCFQVLFGDSKEFYLEKTKGKLASRHPFSKVCFQSSILDTFFLSLKENLTGSLNFYWIVFLSTKVGGGECTPHKVFLIFFFSRIKHQHLTFSVAVRLSLAQILRQV